MHEPNQVHGLRVIERVVPPGRAAALGRSGVPIERGAAVVEFAILLPLFLLVLGGIIDLGRAFFTQIELTNAAREGARAAVVSTAALTDIQARAAAAGIPGMTTTVIAGCPGTDAEVQTSIPFTWIVLEPALNLFNGAGALPNPLTSTAVMKCGG